MRYSRTGIVAVLLAVEVFIAGAILWSLGLPNGFAQASGLHRLSSSGKSFDPIDAGTAPHVTIDDPDTRVQVGVSTDGKVHISDGSTRDGWYWGGLQSDALQVTRTPGGVSIVRPHAGFVIEIFGFSQGRTHVDVPPDASVDIRRSSGADVAGIAGALRVHSVDGSVAVSDLSGGGSITSEDGSIRLDLAQSNLLVHAHTDDGHVRLNGRSIGSSGDDSSSGDFRIGTGSGSLRVSTQDGSINITAQGAQQL